MVASGEQVWLGGALVGWLCIVCGGAGYYAGLSRGLRDGQTMGRTIERLRREAELVGAVDEVEMWDSMSGSRGRGPAGGDQG